MYAIVIITINKRSSHINTLQEHSKMKRNASDIKSKNICLIGEVDCKLLTFCTVQETGFINQSIVEKIMLGLEYLSTNNFW